MYKALLNAALVPAALAAVNIRQTGEGPTGYEADFTYFNDTATNVTIGGGLTGFTDEFHTTVGSSANYDPHDYEPGWFRSQGLSTTSMYAMTGDGAGNWTYTAPFPSGTYQYAFLVDCGNFSACSTIDSGDYVIDPDNPPFVNVQGDQISSTFQVPFDSRFQEYASMDLDFDFALPVEEDSRGSVRAVNYSSPGSVHPAPDVHEFVVYLPHGYDGDADETYPVLYLSHGGGGNGEDWQNLAAASNILDNLIADGHLEPTVVVMPSFYNIAEEYAFTYGSSAASVAPPAPVVRDNYMSHLFPYVQSHFAVSNETSRRAFAGLSLGGMLTYEMYMNATDYFGYFGIFSGVAGPGSPASAYISKATLAANPALAQRGVFTGVGLFDLAFEDVRAFQAAADGVGLQYLSRVVPYGFHFWNTWADCLWHFGRQTLWKPLPEAAGEGE